MACQQLQRRHRHLTIEVLVTSAQPFHGRLTQALVILACFLACSGSANSSKDSSSVAGTVVVRVGSSVITSDMLVSKLRDPSLHHDPDRAKMQAVDDLIRVELLAQEATKRGLVESPAVQAILKKALVQELSRRLVDDGQSDDPSESELEQYLDDHRAEFDKPERIRAQFIFIPCVGAPSDCVSAEAKTRALLSRLRENERRAVPQSIDHAKYQPRLFADLAGTESQHSPVLSPGGEMLFLTREETAAKYSPPVADAVFGLQDVGAMTDVVKGPEGYYVVRLVHRQISSRGELSSPQIHDTIKFRLTADRRNARVEDLVKRLRQSASVDIERDALAAVEIPSSKVTPATRNLPPSLKLPSQLDPKNAP
jgi:peptidyl-prolyl cis-trans isomerase C